MQKKTVGAAILFLCAVSFFFIGKALISKKEALPDQANRIFLVSGDVKITRPNGVVGPQKAASSAVLEKGDIVETAPGATVDIVLGKDNNRSVKIEGNSRVEFREINPTSLDLPKGKILVVLKGLEAKSSFVVKTPTAVCGARGTGWSETTNGKTTTVSVFENEVSAQSVDRRGKPQRKVYTVSAWIQRTFAEDMSVSEARAVADDDMSAWDYWKKNMTFLRDGKVLVNDFDRRENFNNLDGAFGSWNVFYSDQNQYCQDEFSSRERVGETGCSLKLTYDVESSFSAYNGFFTKLMEIDISDYPYLVFSVKGDAEAGFTKTIKVELKNRTQTGIMTVNGITDTWQKMAIPVKDFAGINNFKEMKEFVIVFSDIVVTKKVGAIYIDDIYFARDAKG